MKKFFFSAAAILAGLSFASCNKELSNADQVEGLYSQKEKVTFLVADAATRATAVDDDAVAKVDFFVFRPDGTLDITGSTTNPAEALELYCSKAAGMEVYAVVNAAADLSGVSTKTALLEKVSYLKDNTTENFEMIGSKTVDLTSVSSVVIEVSRFAALVEIDAVKNMLPDAYSGDFKITGMYLINVNNQSSFDLSTAAGDVSGWFNQNKRVAGDADALIYDTLDETVSADASYSTPHYFLAYSNPTTVDATSRADASEAFTARFTRLVIETLINGEKYYYPISLVNDTNIDDARPAGVMSYNTKYRITNVNIKGLGNDEAAGPDVPITKESIGFTMSIEAWKSGMDKEIDF